MLLKRALERSPEALRELKLAPLEVAVVDSGVDATHPDLAGRVIAACRVDAEGESIRIVDVPPPTNNDDFGHGTAVASIIAGIAPNARIVDVRVLGPDNTGSGLALVAGFEYAVNRGCRIINMSLAAKATFAAQLHQLGEQAYRHNQIVVAAKRNMPLVDNGFPAELSSCISVDRDNMPSAFHFRYREDDPIEYVAHGENVTVAAPGGGYTTKTGTSFATPTVSAICALLLGALPELRPFEVKSLLKAFSVAKPQAAGHG